MADDLSFKRTEPEHLALLEELRQREPIFHTEAFGTTLTEVEAAMAQEYWEVGASGRRYSRAFILRTLAGRSSEDANAAGWQTFDHALRRLGEETYLLTYSLRQAERLTRRATIWQRVEQGWRILYHQGTVVETDEDDVAPTPV